ncbi:MAG TPA: EamA family transporter, partial [Thiolinea sp.]|nr:EamA family transporter [Thiolinea sp.]
LTAGGLLLLPVALMLEPPLPALTLPNIAGFVWLGLIGGAFAQLLWFRGIARLEPAIVASLGFLSPVMAVTLGWVLIGQSLTPFQIGFAAFMVFTIQTTMVVTLLFSIQGYRILTRILALFVYLVAMLFS